MSQKLWYRIGFINSNPEIEVCQEIGSNTENKCTLFFVAPLTEQGGTDMLRMRSVQADAEGRPNGYYPTKGEAKQSVINQLEQQLKAMQEAIDSVANVEK